MGPGPQSVLNPNPSPPPRPPPPSPLPPQVPRRQNPARPIHRRRSPKRASLGSSAPGRHRSKALKSPSGYFHRGLSPLWKAPPCSPAVQENEAASFTTQLAHLQYSALCSGKARFV
ncbi:hypothetical protein Pyn_11957 [Prunus yedoensis var. nudiflora]|uniref:Uncharacterized protein n=1 Tax=Prunus yedoensis var. nudiflora TaxID=2094558 RepID=A0A314Y629_PRUYE|nr:hypothetical protein Pyn_11957 [Prunus yedoensis var. nudiflora]